MLIVMQSRLRARPEILTLCLLMVSFTLVESVRRGAAVWRLWWMVPVMVLWANIHGLFFLGLGIMWGMMLGTLIDKALDRFGWLGWAVLSLIFATFVGVVFYQLGLPLDKQPSKLLPNDTPTWQWINQYRHWFFGAIALVVFGAAGFIRRDRGLGDNLLRKAALLPIAAATIACLVNPWGYEMLTHPLLLSTRLSNPVYVTGVTELARTFDHLGGHPDAILLTLLCACAMLANFRRLPMGHVGLYFVFVLMALLAVRNVGMLGPVLGAMLAMHGAGALTELREWLGEVGAPRRRHPAIRRPRRHRHLRRRRAGPDRPLRHGRRL